MFAYNCERYKESHLVYAGRDFCVIVVVVRLKNRKDESKKEKTDEDR